MVKLFDLLRKVLKDEVIEPILQQQIRNRLPLRIQRRSHRLRRQLIRDLAPLDPRVNQRRDPPQQRIRRQRRVRAHCRLVRLEVVEILLRRDHADRRHDCVRAFAELGQDLVAALELGAGVGCAEEVADGGAGDGGCSAGGASLDGADGGDRDLLLAEAGRWRVSERQLLQTGQNKERLLGILPSFRVRGEEGKSDGIEEHFVRTF